MYDFKGKVALVTGAARGIGRAIALELARGGASLALNDVNEAAAAECHPARASRRGQPTRRFYKFDVADSAACDAAVEAVVKDLGGLHVLVNNAGISIDALLLRFKDEDWKKVLDINLTGAFHLMRAAARPLMKAKGAVVNIASVVGEMGNGGQAAYSASKGAPHRAHQDRGQGARLPQRPRERGGPRLHRHPHDPGPPRGGPDEDVGGHSARPAGYPAGHRGLRGLAGQREVVVRDRSGHPRQRWHVHVTAVPRSTAVLVPIPRGKTSMTATNVEAKVKNIIAEQLGVAEEEIKPTSSFIEDLGADSLDIVELVMAMEEEFEVEIPDEEAENIKTVQNAVDYVNSHKK